MHFTRAQGTFTCSNRQEGRNVGYFKKTVRKEQDIPLVLGNDLKNGSMKFTLIQKLHVVNTYIYIFTSFKT